MQTLLSRLALVILLAASAARAAGSKDAAYRAEVEKFRKAREERLKSDDGWLTVAGLYWLREGETSFGCAPENDIMLPDSAPKHAGFFERRGDAVTVRLAADVKAEIDGAPAREALMKPDQTKVTMGRLTLLLHPSGSRLGIRLKDKDNPLRRTFRVPHWFAIDPKWRIETRWVPYPRPKIVEMQNVLGDVAPTKMPGYAELTLGGTTYHLEPEQDDDGSLEFTFRDGTSGRETYAAARFVDAPPPKDGKVVLDFNEAYNPPCAFNKYTTCPLPPLGNRITARITAGERKYKGPHQ